MGLLSEIMAQKCSLHPDVARRLRTAAALHDIGKSKIPGEILNKPDALYNEEWEIMKTHTVLGAEILTDIKGELGEMACLIAQYHHEKWDGSGYWKKYADDLPLYIPIVTIVDMFVALLSERAYKAKWSYENAVEYIQKQAGTYFNPSLVDIFINLVEHDKNVFPLLQVS